MNNELVQTVQNLISNGTRYRVEELDKIYHNDLSIARRISPDETSVIRKTENMNFFKNKKEEGAPPLSPDASFRYAHASGSVGHVVVERKMKLLDKEEHLLYNIVLRKIGRQWKVVSEFITPLS